jgi:hypothetical protein
VPNQDGSPRSDPPPRVPSIPKQRLIDLAPTTTIQDPSETKEALNEARKRLGTSGAPPSPSNPPPGQGPTDPPQRVKTVDPVRVVIAGVLVVAVGVGVWLAMR